jgi:hypothetical protein
MTTRQNRQRRPQLDGNGSQSDGSGERYGATRY